MDVLKLTEKDLFKLRLYDEPIVIDASMYVNKWASPEQSAHLKKLSVIEITEEGTWTITHTLKVLVQSEWRPEPHWSVIEKGTILARRPRSDRKYS